MKCAICERELSGPLEETMTACEKCAGKLGVVPMPPLTRPPTPCSKCNGLEFIRVLPREHTATPGESGHQVTAPMFATHAVRVREGWFSKFPAAIQPQKGVGMLEMFICEGCGFVEWYCADVKDLPVSPLSNSERVDYRSKEGPLR